MLARGGIRRRKEVRRILRFFSFKTGTSCIVRLRTEADSWREKGPYM